MLRKVEKWEPICEDPIWCPSAGCVKAPLALPRLFTVIDATVLCVSDYSNTANAKTTPH